MNHSIDEYVCAKTGATVNAIEGFWAQLKRGIEGTHIHVRAKHFQGIREFEFRWYMRSAAQVMHVRLKTSIVR